MIITVIAHEKNLGLLAITDHLLSVLGKDNCAVLGSNYLIQDNTLLLDQIENHTSNNKSVIIKYVIPKQKFSNQDVAYPKELNEKSDLVFRVPKFTEEIQKPTTLDVYKGEENPIFQKIKEYYS